MVRSAIEARDLTKIFYSKERKGLFRRNIRRKIIAVNHINLSVFRGEIFGLLGPNGAGKTTTIKMLSTLLLPDEGEAWVNGYSIIREPNKVRENIGVSLYSDRGFYWKLTGRENLRFFAYLFHVPPHNIEKRIEEVLRLVELTDVADKLVEEYSMGMKSKLNLARALLTDPPVLFLDEPTIGLDPMSARKVRELILDLKKEGKTILLTTHNMEEADALCDRLAIINKGKIIALGTPSELKLMIKKKEVIVIEAINVNERIVDKLRSLDGIEYVTGAIVQPESQKGVFRICFKGGSKEHLPDVIKVITSFDVKLTYIKIAEPSLEDVFISLTGRGFYEEESNGS